MKKILILFVVVFLSCMVASQEVIDLGLQQKQPAPGEEKKPQLGTREVVAVKVKSYQDIESLWAHFADLIERKQWDLAVEALQRIKDSKNELEIDILPEISVSLTYVGFTLMKKGMLEHAYQCFLYAKDFDPTNLDAYIGIARYFIKKGLLYSVKSVAFLMLSVKGRTATVFSGIQLVRDSAGVLFTMSFFVSIVFAAVLFLKYRALFFHDLQEKYQNSFDEKKIYLIGIAVLLAPLFLFIGWVWLFVFWMILFWEYGVKIEKFVIAVILILFLLWIPLNKFFDELQKACIDPEIRAFHAGLYEKYSPNTIRSLQTQFGEESKNTRPMLMLAGIWKKAGQMDKAIELYTIVLKNDERNVDALNNLGNTYYLLDMQDKAVKNYEQALYFNQDNPTLLYNYSLAVRSQFNFAKAEELMKKAMGVNQNLILSYETRASNKKTVVDFALSQTDLIKLIYQKTSFYSNPTMIMVVFLNSITLIMIVMLVIQIKIRKKFFFAQKCSSCGVPYCKRCQPIDKKYNYCSQCLHLFVKKDGVSHASKKDKMDYIEKWQRKRYALSYLLSLLAPGSGSIYVESIAVLIWAFFLALISPGTWTIKPFIINEFQSWLILNVTVALVVYYFIYNIIYILKPRKT